MASGRTAVLRDPAYLACLAEPTPRTRAAMPGFRGMVRAELVIAASAGRGLGGFAVCLRHDTGPVNAPDPATWLVGPGVVRAQLWAAPAGTPPPMSSETRFRGAPDGTAAGALVVECLREHDAAPIARRLADQVNGDPAAHVGTYRLLSCTGAAPVSAT